MKRCIVAALAMVCTIGTAHSFVHKSQATLWLPDLVSTANSEVRITFSPDGKRMLWGAIGWSGGAGGWDIFESRRGSSGWSKPLPVSFNSDANDFDPSFAPDGSGVYFFSNRPGGIGKDDLYFAAFDRRIGRYTAAVNLGPQINSAGDEWAPVVSPDGQHLMFASDGRGGKGKHDLFLARRAGAQWVEPRNLASLNSPEEDFDAAFLEDGKSVIFSRGNLEGAVVLYLARHNAAKVSDSVALPTFRPVLRLDEAVNSKEPGAWTFGPSISPHDPGALYFTSQRAEHRGRADIYRIEYTVAQ